MYRNWCSIRGFVKQPCFDKHLRAIPRSVSWAVFSYRAKQVCWRSRRSVETAWYKHLNWAWPFPHFPPLLLGSSHTPFSELLGGPHSWGSWSNCIATNPHLGHTVTHPPSEAQTPPAALISNTSVSGRSPRTPESVRPPMRCSQGNGSYLNYLDWNTQLYLCDHLINAFLPDGLPWGLRQ